MFTDLSISRARPELVEGYPRALEDILGTHRNEMKMGKLTSAENIQRGQV